MGRLIGFGSDCFGCSLGEDPALPAIDPSVITGAIPPSLTPATTDQVATMAGSAKKDMLYCAIGAVGIALLADWLIFGKKSYKANARRGYSTVWMRDLSTQRKGRRTRIQRSSAKREHDEQEARLERAALAFGKRRRACQCASCQERRYRR